MKAATGELNLTVITIIAIGAVLAFFWLFWPKIQESISSQWDNATKVDNNYGVPGYIVLPELYK